MNRSHSDYRPRFTNDFPCGIPQDNKILALWRAGKDTFDISQALWCPEHHIALRLPAILDRARQDQEWNFDVIAAVPGFLRETERRA